MARTRFELDDSELTNHLLADTFSAAAEMSIHLQYLEQIVKAFFHEQLPLVLLKGAALGQSVYADPILRVMSDIDLWVQEADVPQAVAALADLGFKVYGNDERPLALQQQSKGEIRLIQPGAKWGLVELHWSPFPGWWLQRTAVPDDQAVWSRKELLPDGRAYQLSAEDTIIQSAVHMAVNHQFDILTIRHLLDMALTAENRGVDWLVVAEQAQKWRLGTVVYVTLDLLDNLVGLAGVGQAMAKLEPSQIRKHLLARLVTTESVVRGRQLKYGRSRFMLLLLLVDRPQDMLKLIYRTLWPEPEWMAARYKNKTVSRWQHMWQVLRYGKI